MSSHNFQIIGLILNFFGTILFGVGVLDNSSPTWGDVQKESTKAIWIHRLAWFGFISIAIGFVMQFFAAI